MTNILNEEIRVIQNYMTHLNKAIALSVDTGEKIRLKKKYEELESILDEKLHQCDEYIG